MRACALAVGLLVLVACSDQRRILAPEVVSASAALPAASTAESPSAAAAAHHCEGSPAQCQANAAAPDPQPVAGGELYGAAFDDDLDVTPLPTLLARPTEFAGKVVRTTGTIARVCQQRGCWMELRSGAVGNVARVPMAGHAFFVPPDSSGRLATVQGEVSVTDGRDNPLRIDATGVLIASGVP